MRNLTHPLMRMALSRNNRACVTYEPTHPDVTIVVHMDNLRPGDRVLVGDLTLSEAYSWAKGFKAGFLFDDTAAPKAIGAPLPKVMK